MKNLTFTRGNLRKETPRQVKQVYRVFMLLSTIWAVTIQPNFNFNDHAVAEVNKWLLVANGVIYHLCQYFGWKMGESDEAPSTTGSTSKTLLLLIIGGLLLTGFLFGCSPGPVKMYARFDKLKARCDRDSVLQLVPPTWANDKYPVLESSLTAIEYLPGVPIPVPGATSYVTVDCDSARKAQGGSIQPTIVKVPVPVYRQVDTARITAQVTKVNTALLTAERIQHRIELAAYKVATEQLRMQSEMRGQQLADAKVTIKSNGRKALYGWSCFGLLAVFFVAGQLAKALTL